MIFRSEKTTRGIEEEWEEKKVAKKKKNPLPRGRAIRRPHLSRRPRPCHRHSSAASCSDLRSPKPDLAGGRGGRGADPGCLRPCGVAARPCAASPATTRSPAPPPAPIVSSLGLGVPNPSPRPNAYLRSLICLYLSIRPSFLPSFLPSRFLVLPAAARACHFPPAHGLVCWVRSCLVLDRIGLGRLLAFWIRSALLGVSVSAAWLYACSFGVSPCK